MNSKNQLLFIGYLDYRTSEKRHRPQSHVLLHQTNITELSKRIQTLYAQ